MVKYIVWVCSRRNGWVVEEFDTLPEADLFYEDIRRECPSLILEPPIARIHA